MCNIYIYIRIAFCRKKSIYIYIYLLGTHIINVVKIEKQKETKALVLFVGVPFAVAGGSPTSGHLSV